MSPINMQTIYINFKDGTALQQFIDFCSNHNIKVTKIIIDYPNLFLIFIQVKTLKPKILKLLKDKIQTMVVIPDEEVDFANEYLKHLYNLVTHGYK